MKSILDVILRPIIIVIITFVLLKVTRAIFDRTLKYKKDINIKYLRAVVSGLIVLLGVVTVGMQFNVTAELSKMVLKSTGLFVAVAGFAAQSVLADVISGFVLSLSKPFNIGERITLKSSGVSGIVEDITLRHTVIQCFDEVRVIIPNSIINKELIQNSNYDSIAGNAIEFIVGYNSDIRKAIDIIKSEVINHPLVIDKSKDDIVDKEVCVTVARWEDSGIILKVTVWTSTVNDNFTACSDLRLSIKEKFDAEGIEIPYNYIHLVHDDKENKL